MEDFFDFFFCFSCLQESKGVPWAPLPAPGASLLWLLPQSYRLPRFLTISFMSLSEQVFTPEVSKFILCSYFGGAWDSDFLPWRFPSTACWVACFRTAAQGLWMDGWVFFSVICARKRQPFLCSHLCAVHSGSALCCPQGFHLDLCPQMDVKTPALGIPASPGAA